MSFENKKNLYICKGCGHAFVTLDTEKGVTPFMTECIQKCGEMATSTMYNIPQKILGNPAVKWIKPPKSDWKAFKSHTVEHLRKGGLLRDDQVELSKKTKQKRAFRP